MIFKSDNQLGKVVNIIPSHLKNWPSPSKARISKYNGMRMKNKWSKWSYI